MSTIRRAVTSAAAVGAVLGMTACTGDTKPSPSASQPASSSSSSSSAPSASPGSSSSSPKVPATSSAAPTTGATKGSDKDKGAIPVTQGALPPGPVTDIKVKLLGGYDSLTGAPYGEFYAVLDVTSTAKGLMDVDFVLVDAAGKDLKRVNQRIDVGGTAHELKIAIATGALPTAGDGKVAKVRLDVTENDANFAATVTQIQPGLKIGVNPEGGQPTVSGKYKTIGESEIATINAVCTDAQGVTRTGNAAVSDPSAPNFVPFTITVDSKKGFVPKNCYVGS